ncbi:hypothetical protein MRX96_002125 [Rhipicephalus microplus]
MRLLRSFGLTPAAAQSAVSKVGLGHITNLRPPSGRRTTFSPLNVKGDVIPYPKLQGQSHAFDLVVVNRGKRVNSASIRTSFSASAEATVIALAIRMADKQGTSAYVVSDCQTACRMYLKGILLTKAIKLLGNELPLTMGLSGVRLIRARMAMNLFIAKLEYSVAKPHYHPLLKRIEMKE